MKTKQKSLKNLIKARKFDWVTSFATEEKFPKQEIRKGTYKLLHFNKYLSQDELLKEIKAQGCEPANVYELLGWDGWKDEEYVVAAGQLWTDADGYRSYLYLRRLDAERDLNYVWLNPTEEWDDYWRFLVLASGSENSDTLPALKPLDLESAIQKVKDAGYIIYKPI